MKDRPLQCAGWLADFWNDLWQIDAMTSTAVAAAALSIMFHLELDMCQARLVGHEGVLAGLDMWCIVELNTESQGQVVVGTEDELEYVFERLQLGFEQTG